MHLWYNNRKAAIIPDYGQGDALAKLAPAPMANYTISTAWIWYNNNHKTVAEIQVEMGDFVRIPEMTSTERVMAAINGSPFDVYPAISVTSVATIDGMNQSGAYFPSAHTNGTEMADLAAVGHDEYGFDSAAPYFSIHLEAAALGADVDWSDRFGTPSVRGILLSNLDQLDIPQDFLSRPLPMQLLRALRILHKRYKGEVPVIGKVVGPWTLAYHLRGVENLLLDTILEPQKTSNAIAALAEISVQFAQAQFEAGADIVVWADHVTSDLVSAQIYREIVFPVHCMATRKLAPLGPLILHVCGNVEDRFDLFAQAGFTCFHMDSRNNIPAIVQAAGRRIRLAGCINNPFTLSQGTPGGVQREVEYNMACGISLIAPECAIPTSVPTANLKELVRTAHSHRFGGAPNMRPTQKSS